MATYCESPVFAVLEKSSLREKIAEIIQEKILNSEFKPGDRVVESSVAAQMRVGQNTVREALQILEHQGLVTKVPRTGTFVTKLSDDEVTQAYRVRSELEALAVEVATERLDDNGLATLYQLAEEITNAARSHEFVRYMRADLEFHKAVWELSANRFLKKALLAITQPLFAYQLIRNFQSGTRNFHEAAEVHRRIVDMMKTKDASTAREFARQQILDLWAGTMRELKQRDAEAHAVPGPAHSR